MTTTTRGRQPRRETWRRAAVAIALAAPLTIAVAAQAGEPLVRGTLVVTGTRWVNGVASRVSCRSSFGGFMNAGPTLRLLAVAPTDTCPMAADGEALPPSPFGGLRFVGATRDVTDRGKAKRQRIYAAVPTTPNLEGFMIGLIKVDRDGRPTSEKGTLLYRQVVEDRVVQFRGTYRSRLRR